MHSNPPSFDSGPDPVPPISPRVLVPVPPDPSYSPPPLPARAKAPAPVPELPAPALYRSGSGIVVENGAILPQGLCVKCGRPAQGSRHLTLRNPRAPRTWFGRGPVLQVGLCRKHTEDRSVAVALTWSVLAVGALIFIAGVVTLEIAPLVFGLGAMAGAGWFRAVSPVSLSGATLRGVVVQGAAEAFLFSLPPRPDPDETTEAAASDPLG